MKSERVVSPDWVPAPYTIIRDGSASKRLLTLIRAASPVCCEPVPVIAPVYGTPLSTNSGSCGLPLVRSVIVIVEDAELTTLLQPASPLICCVCPLGLVNCGPVLPIKPLSCEMTELMPPEKSTP